MYPSAPAWRSPRHIQNHAHAQHRRARARTTRARGCALIAVYGAVHAAAQSFRAIYAHALTDPFPARGTCDLTANVDFAYLAKAPLVQGAFLACMGVDEHTETHWLSNGHNGAVALRMAAQQLVDPAVMCGGVHDARARAGVPGHSSTRCACGPSALATLEVVDFTIDGVTVDDEDAGTGGDSVVHQDYYMDP
ncbi:hypothetical protein GGX14DRAFT_568232 [Mycena pura]|uniref:Protein arginine methyltransferase NDUFAF7 n=1 Tax=Mycena pura TaxID=153505 RepID=A0AAD6VCW1_9AGAR|nr:hypothetical protein GGX14DRAFT_568232 [Mycena pura]